MFGVPSDKRCQDCDHATSSNGGGGFITCLLKDQPVIKTSCCEKWKQPPTTCKHDWIPVKTVKNIGYGFTEKYIANFIEVADDTGMWGVVSETETIQQLYCPNCNTYREVGKE